MIQVLSTDETTQKFGCVMVFFAGFADKETDFLKEPNIKENIRKFVATFPVRISASHVCFPKIRIYQLAFAAISLISPKIIRVRVRRHAGECSICSASHCIELHMVILSKDFLTNPVRQSRSLFVFSPLTGSYTECKYSLMTHGIPSDQLPITASGRVKTTNHHRWIKFQREKEDSIQMGLPPFESVDCPLVMDILIGNAGHNTYFKNNPGNTFYRDVMDSYFGRYEAASDTQEKTRITWKVLEELEKVGGRVLVRDRRGWWSVAGTNKAREKIAHDFRETRKKKQAAAAAAASGKNRAVTAYNVTSTTADTSNAFAFAGETAARWSNDQKKRCFGIPGNMRTNDSDSDDQSGMAGCLPGFL